MSRFTGPDPLGRYLEDGINFWLHEKLEYDVGEKDSGERITVPEGFITDFASIPMVIQALIPKCVGRRAAIVHDFLYRTLGDDGRYARWECDRIFLEALGVLNVPAWRRYALYWGVRFGGWLTWARYESALPPK
jgi:hypothetical protein